MINTCVGSLYENVAELIFATGMQTLIVRVF